MNKYFISTVVLLFALVALSAFVIASNNAEITEVDVDDSTRETAGDCSKEGFMECNDNGDGCRHKSCACDNGDCNYNNWVDFNDDYSCATNPINGDTGGGQKCTYRRGCSSQDTACEFPNMPVPVPLPEGYDAR